MTTSDLVAAVAKNTGHPTAQVKQTIEAVFAVVTKTLKAGNKVTLTGYGVFAAHKRKARTGRNPSTGASIKIPAKRVVKFKAGKKITSALN